jgi:competence protein CoiA
MSTLFGLDQSNRLVSVSEVSRGLACRCRCVVCAEPLIARQGTVREHHFAHASEREPCDAPHESLLHLYAKRVISEAGGLTVPLTNAVSEALRLEKSDQRAADLRLASVEQEKTLAELRPDLLAVTAEGVSLAIEIAYTSFCDRFKVAQFAKLELPAVEIDLRAFTPDAFDPIAVKAAVLGNPGCKSWLWPTNEPTAKPRLPEEIIVFSDRWVSIKEFPSGDIAVKAVKYDPDLVSLIREVAKASGASYAPKYKTWNVPRWRAEHVRQTLRNLSNEVRIRMDVEQPAGRRVLRPEHSERS